MTKAIDEQVGGGHYKGMKIQPIEFCHANSIPFVEGNIIKYVCRWRSKNGVEDLKKARHMLDMLIELEHPPTPVRGCSTCGQLLPRGGCSPITPCTNYSSWQPLNA